MINWKEETTEYQKGYAIGQTENRLKHMVVGTLFGIAFTLVIMKTIGVV